MTSKSVRAVSTAHGNRVNEYEYDLIYDGNKSTYINHMTFLLSGTKKCWASGRNKIHRKQHY